MGVVDLARSLADLALMGEDIGDRAPVELVEATKSEFCGVKIKL